jgi:hypothetical protein
MEPKISTFRRMRLCRQLRPLHAGDRYRADRVHTKGAEVVRIAGQHHWVGTGVGESGHDRVGGGDRPGRPGGSSVTSRFWQERSSRLA